MNERIRELALQAGFETNGAICSFGNYKIDNEYFFAEDFIEDELAKFAELIVRECSKVIVNGGYRNPALGDKHPLTPPEIAQMIREHFGVEE